MNAAGYEFWKKVDELNPFSTIKELSEKVGLEYNTAKRQRSENRAPKRRFIEAIAKELGIAPNVLFEPEESIDNEMDMFAIIRKSPRLIRLMHYAVGADEQALELAEYALRYSSKDKQLDKDKEDVGKNA